MTAFSVVCLILLANYGSNGRELSRGREEAERHYWNDENIRSKPSLVKDYVEDKINRVGDPLRSNRFNLKSDGSERAKWLDYEEDNWKGMNGRGRESGAKFLDQEIRRGGGESRGGLGRDEVIRTLTTENPGILKSLLRMETRKTDLDLDKDNLSSLSVFAKLQPHSSIMTDKGFTLLEKLKILKESMDEGASRLSSYAKDFKEAVNNYIVTTYPTEFDAGHFKEFSSYKKMSPRPNIFMAAHAVHAVNGSLDSTNWFTRLNKTDPRKYGSVELPQAVLHNSQSKCGDNFLHELFEKLKKCPFVFDACMNLKTPLDSEYPIAGENKIHLTVKLDSLFNILEMITKIMKEASEKGGAQEGAGGLGDWNKKQPSTANTTTAKYQGPKTLYVQPESPKQFPMQPTTPLPTMFMKLEKDAASSSSYSSASVSSTTPGENSRVPNSPNYSNDTASGQKTGLVNRKPTQMLRHKFVSTPINTSQHKLQKAPGNEKTLISRPRVVDYETVNDEKGAISRKRKRDSKGYFPHSSSLEQNHYHSNDKTDKLGLNTLIEDIIKKLSASNSRTKKSPMFDVRSSKSVSTNDLPIYLTDDKLRGSHTRRFKTKEEESNRYNNESDDPIISSNELNNLVQTLKDDNMKHIGNMFKRSLDSVDNYNYELTPDICRLNNKKIIRKKRSIDNEKENLKRILENMKRQSLVQQNIEGSPIHTDQAFPLDGFENVINISQNVTASEPLNELVKPEVNEGLRVKRSSNGDNVWYPEDIHFDDKNHLLKNALFGDDYSGGKGDQSSGVIDALSPKVIWSASEPPPKDLREALKSGLSPVVLPSEENSYQTDLNVGPVELRRNDEVNDEREFLDKPNAYDSRYGVGLRVKKNPSYMSENRDWTSLMRRSYPHELVEQEDQELLSPLQMDYDLNQHSGWNAKRQAADFPHGWPDSNQQQSAQASHLGSVYGPLSDSYTYPLSDSYSGIPWQNPMHHTRCKKECDGSNKMYPSLEGIENKGEASLEGFLRGVDQFRTRQNHEGNSDPNRVADTLSNGSIMSSFTELANRIADKVKPHSVVQNLKNPSSTDNEKETRRKKRFVQKSELGHGRESIDDPLQGRSSKINYNMEDVEDVINTAVNGEPASAEEIDRKMRKLNNNFFSKSFENEDSPSEDVAIGNETPAASSEEMVNSNNVKLREKLKITDSQSNDGGSPVFDGSGSTPSDMSSQGGKSVNNTLKTIKSGNKSNLYKTSVNEFYETEDNTTQKCQITKKPEGEQFWANKSDEFIKENESVGNDSPKILDPFNLTNYNAENQNLDMSDSQLREFEAEPNREKSGGKSRKSVKEFSGESEAEDFSPIHHNNRNIKLNEMSEESKKENKYDSFEDDEQNNSDSRELRKTEMEDSDSEGQEISLETSNSGSINSKKVDSVLSEMAGDVKSLRELTKQLQFSQKKIASI